MKYPLLLSLLTLASTASAQQKMNTQGHRGARGLMPENSIASMIYAVHLGVQTLELDCVISKDQQVVVSHDVYMSGDFMTKPDGKLISKDEQTQLLLFKMPYTEIKTYDGGLKPHPQFPDQKKMKSYKPLLAELIDSVERHVKLNKLKPVYYNLEIKSSSSGDNTAHPVPAVFVKLVMDVLKEKGIEKRVTIQSFDTRPLQILHEKYKGQTLSYLVMSKAGFKEQINTLGFLPDIISPYYTMIDQAYVTQAQEQNVKVVPWTINDEAAIKKTAELKVDGMISDYPDRLIKIFGSYQK
jgi:glycerophosphoryl diester phosphodiesterase